MLSIFQWVNTGGKEAALLRTKHFRRWRKTQRDWRKKKDHRKSAVEMKAVFVIIVTVIKSIII